MMKPKSWNHRAVLSVVAVGLVVSVTRTVAFGFPVAAQAAQAAHAASAHKRLTWDVAIDCRTWRFNGGISFEEFGRGDGFLAEGRIFRGGTLGAGAQMNDPNEPGNIGTWTQRGTMAATGAEIVGGARPAFFATWFHFLKDGSGVVADGPHPESGPMAIVGGMGRFSGASGELSDEIIGTNSTGCPNLRLTIELEKQGDQVTDTSNVRRTASTTAGLFSRRHRCLHDTWWVLRRRLPLGARREKDPQWRCQSFGIVPPGVS